MDKKIFEELRDVLIAIEPRIAHDKEHWLIDAVTQVEGWMDEVEKEIEDYETLGTDERPSLRPCP